MNWQLISNYIRIYSITSLKPLEISERSFSREMWFDIGHFCKEIPNDDFKSPTFSTTVYRCVNWTNTFHRQRAALLYTNKDLYCMTRNYSYNWWAIFPLTISYLQGFIQRYECHETQLLQFSCYSLCSYYGTVHSRHMKINRNTVTLRGNVPVQFWKIWQAHTPGLKRDNISQTLHIHARVCALFNSFSAIINKIIYGF